MTDLRQNADAISDGSGRVLSGTVLKLLDNGKRIVQNPVILVSVDINNGTDTAGIMIVLKLSILSDMLCILVHTYFSSFVQSAKKISRRIYELLIFLYSDYQGYASRYFRIFSVFTAFICFSIMICMISMHILCLILSTFCAGIWSKTILYPILF